MNLWIFKTFLDMVRMSPDDYAHQFSIHYACESIRLPPLIGNPQLYEASFAQMQYLVDPECPFSHTTCPKYCSHYVDCSLNARVLSFCPSCEMISENIMKGIQNPFRSHQLFLEKEGHCQNIFSLDHNQIGMAFHSKPNIYVQTFAYVPKSFFYNPLVSGCHLVLNDTHITFYLNCIESEPTFLMLQCTSLIQFPLFLFLYPNTYSITLPINTTQCHHYYFQTQDFRYPEFENFLLNDLSL